MIKDFVKEKDIDNNVMRTVDDCIEKAIRGFDGTRFYLSYFNGESYLSLIDDTILLLSKKSISEKSVSRRFGFMTEVCLDELQDITLAKLYVTYGHNEYEALSVSKDFEEIVLKARKGLEYEDKKLGFKDNIHERLTIKLITLDEVESIRVEEKSVYEELKNKAVSF